MPGVLKAKVSGTWVPITGPGQGVPPGGAAGSVLMKNTASNFDAGWITPANTGFVQRIGDSMTGPLVMTNGLITVTPSSTAGLGLVLNPAVGATNEGGQLQLSGAASYGAVTFDNYNGTLRILMPGASGSVAVQIQSNGRFDINTDAQGLYFPNYGGGWFMQDSTWIRAHGSKNIYTAGEIRGGSKFSFDTGAGWVFTNSSDTDTGIYYWGNDDVGFATAGVQRIRASGSSIILTGNTTVSGNIYPSNLGDSGTSPAEAYVANWWRVRNTGGGIYWQHGAGLTSPAGGWVTTYSSHFALQDYVLRFRTYTDGNHQIAFSSAGAASIHAASGVGSNGPWLQGYGTVVLSCVQFGATANTLWSNNWFVDAGLGYQKFSTGLIKDDIESIDPNEALAQVNRWRPITFLSKVLKDGVRYDGFIAEELHAVNPRLVACVREDNGETPEEQAARNADPDRPSIGAPHAIDYGQLTVRLTGAVQALTARLEELERKVAA